jgi:hypothetical protein
MKIAAATLKIMGVGALLLFCHSCARLKYAFNKEIRSSHVWAPVALAGLVRIHNYDAKIADWGRLQNPLFGNQDRAERRSDQFNDVLEYEAYVTLIFSPTLEGEFSWSKFGKKKGVELLALEGGVRGSYWTTQGGKKLFRRERPQQQDNLSFPSGHATAAGAWRKAADNNLDNFDKPYPVLGALNQSLAIGTMWARIEAGKHYPSDVLVGYAFGSFITGMVWSATFTPSAGGPFVSLTPTMGGTGITSIWPF